MGSNAAKVIRSFDELPDTEKKIVANQVLLWWRETSRPALTDEELTALADSAFLALDREEDSNGQTQAR